MLKSNNSLGKINFFFFFRFVWEAEVSVAEVVESELGFNAAVAETAEEVEEAAGRDVGGLPLPSAVAPSKEPVDKEGVLLTAWKSL